MWKGRNEFFSAQVQVALILLFATIGNNWTPSYPRNDNHNPQMFWIMIGCLGVATLCSLKHDKSASARGVQLLSRAQTEEFKGAMQFAFIMYHYYRAYFAYNEIRVFVSAYVWMTGFGNFLYFTKKQDFSLERVVSMWIRINYFPILLSVFLSVPLELYYVVPLHTVGFFITMATCYLSYRIQEKTEKSAWTSNVIAVLTCLAVHVVFYETPLVECLKFFSDEYHFRFQADKYSAWMGMVAAMCWPRFKKYMQWAYAGDSTRVGAQWTQRLVGFMLLFIWYNAFGYMKDKYTYNPIHPYIFWLPLAGYLMIRNSSRFLCETHSRVLEFFGRITLETYVLQFHLFMCANVQHIPVVIPGSGPDGTWYCKLANMLLCGVIFVLTALWARKVTISTQTTVVELVTIARKKWSGVHEEDSDEEEDDLVIKEKESFLVENGDSNVEVDVEVELVKEPKQVADV